DQGNKCGGAVVGGGRNEGGGGGLVEGGGDGAAFSAGRRADGNACAIRGAAGYVLDKNSADSRRRSSQRRCAQGALARDRAAHAQRVDGAENRRWLTGRGDVPSAPGPFDRREVQFGAPEIA